MILTSDLSSERHSRCFCLNTIIKILLRYTVSQKKNAPTLANFSFDKHGRILIILCKQHQHTSKNDMNIQLCLFLHFYLLYLLSLSLNSCRVDQNSMVGAVARYCLCSCAGDFVLLYTVGQKKMCNLIFRS